MKFAVVCILFVLAALTYFRLQHQINIESDVIGPEKKDQLRNIKMMLQWLMIGLGILVILCGYDLLYVPGADKYLGAKCNSSCSSGPRLRSLSSGPSTPVMSSMPKLLPDMSSAYSGVSMYSLPDF